MHDLDRVVLGTRGHEQEALVGPDPDGATQVLLSIDGDQELDDFLGRLLAGAGRHTGRPVPRSLRRPLAAYLKGAAAAALPARGFRAGKSAAAQAGARAGRKIAGSVESSEFEFGSGPGQAAARQIVQLAGAMADEAARLPQGSTSAATVARRVENAMIPSLGQSSDQAIGRARRGTWTMRGRQITLHV